MIEDSLPRPEPAKGSTAAAAPIERRILVQLLEDIGGDTAALAGLLSAYLDDTPQILQEMAQALATSDRAALAMAAHTLKSTSASIGAMRLAALCEELNHTLRSGVTADGPLLYEGIKAEFERGRVLLAAPPSAQGIDVQAVLRRVG